ncbi:hypothetical protein [Spiroplasma endosymbiont of Cantharis lateralis]|uniref:hypothetical protein n=1 Tax=Spiroplasma endosymbiont of Cantharis lateralis TaxID=3066277 RepID=UPI00313CC7AE
MGQSLLSIILFGKEMSPEKATRLKVQEQWLNSKEYRDLRWQNEADVYAKKILKIIFEIKYNNKNSIDSSKQWQKIEKIRQKQGTHWIEKPEIDKWGCDERSISGFKRGDTSLQIWNFNYWFIHEVLKKEELYNWLMDSRAKEDFKRNGQDHDVLYWNIYEAREWDKDKDIFKKEQKKDKDFNYLKFLKEHVYTPLLIEKQIEYGVYNWIPEKVCHPERFEKKEINNNNVDKQIELLKQQQSILDRQIELEKFKEIKNNRG